MASQLHIKDDHQISEPPSVEGYVSRVKPGSGTHEEVYLTVHNGLLFTLAPANAHAPNPPGAIPVPQDSDRDARDALRQEEIRRGAAQVLAARGVMDLRSVIAVRRAFRPVLHQNEHIHTSTQPEIEESEQPEQEVCEESDTQDVGGHAGLTGDLTTMRMRRCFELVMKSGQVIRFEVRHFKRARSPVYLGGLMPNVADLVCESCNRVDRASSCTRSLLDATSFRGHPTGNGRCTFCHRSTTRNTATLATGGR